MERKGEERVLGDNLTEKRIRRNCSEERGEKTERRPVDKRERKREIYFAKKTKRE